MQANKNSKFRKSVAVQNPLLLSLVRDYYLIVFCTYHDFLQMHVACQNAACQHQMCVYKYK